MFAYKIAAAAMALAIALPACAQAPGSNPILRDTFTADPAALVVGDTVYLYVGHDAATEKDKTFNMPEWLLYSSKDMKHWAPHGTILKPTDFKWATREAWASQVVAKNGKYYFFATAQHDESKHGKAIGVAVADKPTGPFVDARGSALITNDMTPQGKHGWSDIDPTVITDAQGVSWMMWGNKNLFLVKLKPNMTELDGPIREIKLTNYLEGPWLHRRGKSYYLTYASIDEKTQKNERISYATAPSVEGPWTYRGELTGEAENSFTIHPAIIEFKGKWYFIAHNGTLTLGDRKGGEYRRSVTVEHLRYNRDGTMQPVVQTKEGISR